MYEIVKALEYIDEDIIFDALQTIGIKKEAQKNNVQMIRWKRPTRNQGGAKAKVLAIGSCILAVCISIIIWAAIVLTGNQSTDIYCVGDEKVLDSFSSVQDIYPDEEMANHLSTLKFQSMEISLYYTEGESWENSDNWYSLIFSGRTGAQTEDGTFQTITLMCLFTGTLDDWKVSTVDSVKDIVVENTEIQLAYNKTTDCRYAFFEKNGVVYDLRIQFANPTEAEQIAILELLLK